MNKITREIAEAIGPKGLAWAHEQLAAEMLRRKIREEHAKGNYVPKWAEPLCKVEPKNQA